MGLVPVRGDGNNETRTNEMSDAAEIVKALIEKDLISSWEEARAAWMSLMTVHADLSEPNNCRGRAEVMKRYGIEVPLS